MRWVIVILLPASPIDAAVHGFRQRYDPLVDHIEPHVTLVHPFEDELTPTELQAHVETVAESHEPFRLALGDVTPFGREFDSPPDRKVRLRTDTTVPIGARIEGSMPASPVVVFVAVALPAGMIGV